MVMKYKHLLVTGVILALSITPANAGILSGIKNFANGTVNLVITEAKNLPGEIIKGIVSIKVVPTVAGLVKLCKVHNPDSTYLKSLPSIVVEPGQLPPTNGTPYIQLSKTAKPHTFLLTLKTDTGKVFHWLITVLKPIPGEILDAVLVLKLLPFFLTLI